ncbi:MAG: hypothetical protein KC931_07665 [Candidatus Omnitrophica bacterium]|nr:hypothetical protein [Candidatus Omnitrophota bacterium]MCA9416405.1 hypothetical protein [Candidatus Omnitrophota bacterium]MCA9425300.1 hypothetical protein [Candidatus Omnitrophota bacterium]MCA9430400.1 hypothetical protein [Candidatus Omnitrophota bacterium]MCA9435706.1 hypothetical protein [Candidatus Omnitrophota bacterium]
MRVNLIQKFFLWNLVWHLAIGIYFGVWFSERLVDSVTRFQTSNLADDLRTVMRKRIRISFLDEIPKHPNEAQARLESIEESAGFLSGDVYKTQILWNLDQAVWSNQPSVIGNPLIMDEGFQEAFDKGQEFAELTTNRYGLIWMWQAMTNEEAVINDASSAMRVLLPIRFPRASVLPAAKGNDLKSEILKKRIIDAAEGSEVVAGVLELRIDPKEIIEKTIKDVRSVWKRVGVIYMLSNIVLFGLFKSAFNTIQRQSRELREQERLSNLGKMASYLAHEIRNPLFIIRGSAQTIEETSPDTSPSKKLAVYVIDEVDRLNNMVQDLLGLVKPRLAPAKSPTSLKRAIEDSSERSLKQSPKVELVEQLDPEHDLVWFNRGQLIQVFTNLFRNARDACKGQGTILVESRVSGEGHLQIRVTDDGPGISEEHLSHVFDPFFTGKENGTGLGLAIVRHLVTGNNATIEAVKPTGTGACFILNVRLAPEGAAPSEEEETDIPEELS